MARRAPKTNADAIEVTLSELGRAGRLEDVDAARVQALRSIAAALDKNPFSPQMWREYREAIGGLAADDGDDGSVEDLLDELSSSVRDPSPTRARDVRSRARGDS